MPRILRAVLLVLQCCIWLLIPVCVCFSEEPAKTPDGRSATLADPSLLEVLKWHLVGPFHGGISEAVVGDPSNPYVFYEGTSGGGIWKTDDAGLRWYNISDGFFNTSTIGALAI